MDNIIFLFIIFVFLELFEAFWQRADDLYGVIYKNYFLFKKSFLNFLLFNLSFFYVLFLIAYLSIDSFLLYIIIAGLKFADILFKLNTIKKLDNFEKMEEIVPVNIKISFLYRYMNVIIYPTTFLYTFI